MNNFSVVSKSHVKTFLAVLFVILIPACGGDNNNVPTYAVDAIAGSGGSIAANRAKINGVPVDVREGDTTDYTVTPDTGYRIDTVSGCGGSLSGNIYTTAPITGACTITASFALKTYVVTVSSGEGGSVLPASALVDHGRVASFTVIPDDGYSIDNVTGCGGSLSGSTYTTSAVTADCSVTASFVADVVSYTVSAVAGAGGNITPASTLVDSGNTASFALTPDTGYSIDNVTGCGGSLSGNTYTTGAITSACTVSASFAINSYTVSATAGSGGSITPASSNVDHGSSTSLTVTPDAGYSIDSVSGCGGSLSGNTYTTGAITAACTVSASFVANSYTVSATAGSSGSIAPASTDVPMGADTSFTITPDAGFDIASVSGCGGSLNGNTYTTAAVNADCTVSVTFERILDLSFVPVKTFRFAWADLPGTSYYKMMENPDGQSGYTQIGSNIPQGVQSFDHIVPLHQRVNAQYLLQACDAADNCSDLVSTSVTDNMAGAIGYFKASNTESRDGFGMAVAISGDGSTLAVGARDEDGLSPGINGDQANGTYRQFSAGAVYVFARDASGNWAQQAYVKASNPEGAGYDSSSWTADYFGAAVSLNSDGSRLLVGAPGEDSGVGGVSVVGVPGDNSRGNSGAAYVFTRSGNTWTQTSYVKAFSPVSNHRFGTALSMSDDGLVFVVGANGGYNSALVGAAYVFRYDSDVGNYVQESGLYASNGESFDIFGMAVALSGDGNTVAVGASYEDSGATGINGSANAEDDNSAERSGAVYVFAYDGSAWSQQAYIKASNTDADDFFGRSLSISRDGNTLAVGANREDSAGQGIEPPMQDDNSASASGAVYVFVRDAADNWSQQAYIKASNAETADYFGSAPNTWNKEVGGTLALSADGNILAVGAMREASTAIGINGDQMDNGRLFTGAAYVFTRSGGTSWSQQAYVKPSNAGGWFGMHLDMSDDGSTLAVGAAAESSNATGVGGDATDTSAYRAGAVYLY